MSTSERTYTISQLAREYQVTPRALRFYEDKGLLTPRREGMNRVYSHRDRAKLQLILRGKRVGLSLIEIKEILDLYKVDQRAQAQTALKRFRSRIAALEEQRKDVDAAIEALHAGVRRAEAFLSKPAAPAAVGAARAFEKEAKKRLEDAR
ncbi:MAG: MerR family DNA-binding transcriptional regulator [Hyphomonadaceae bacterium]|nr:MerR family DNA-binding transcriptional regulator [Hyphomonadaceae bacterium]